MTVKLYSKTVCPKCFLLKRELQGAGVEYTEINIDHSDEARELLIEKGFMQLPVVEIDGEFTDNKELVYDKLNVEV